MPGEMIMEIIFELFDVLQHFNWVPSPSFSFSYLVRSLRHAARSGGQARAKRPSDRLNVLQLSFITMAWPAEWNLLMERAH